MNRPSLLWLVCLSLIFASMGGCATLGQPVIQERSTLEPSKANSYVVIRGDTLFSIAWKFHTTVDRIARLNGLAKPYTIQPGQRLRLKGSLVARAPSAPAQPKPAARKPTATAKKTPTPATVRDKDTRIVLAKRWRWPVAAAPSREFGRGNKGLDFQVPRGTRVQVAAPGDVVYAGTGLGGYARLVIVRHDDQWLSAYSVNQAVSVAEGDVVKDGATIAEIEGTGRAARLHFEIRKDGEPVSPRSVLN